MMMIECGETPEATAEQLKQLMRLSSTPTTLNITTVSVGGQQQHQLHGQLNSANSFESGSCNVTGGGGGGGTSLSEDSGLPYTNSSVSSDSIRCIGALKLEMELMTESEGEASQFDSLDNCSDGGMSAENFNTLKKGPLAPIEPPPQFQDSPQTTLLRSPLLQSFAMRITRTLLKTAMQQYLADCPAYIESPPTDGLVTMSSIHSPPPAAGKAGAVTVPIDLPLLRCHRPRSPTPQQLASRRLYAGCKERRLHLSAVDLYTEPTTTATSIAASKTSTTRRHPHYRNHNCHHNDAADDYYANGSCSSPSSTSSAENIYDVPNIDSDTEHTRHTTKTVADAEAKLDIRDRPASPIVTAATPLTQKRSPNGGGGGVIGSCEIYDYDLYYRKQPDISQHDRMPVAQLPQPKHHGHKHHKHHHHHHHHQHDHHKHHSSNHLLEIRTTTSAAAFSTRTTSSPSATASTTTTTSSKKNLLYSPRHYTAGSNLSTAQRPNSRNSLTSRLSSSHNSLSVPTTNKADDSIFITQAMSHDTLTGREINDFYNVPCDSDIYSLPVDMVGGQQPQRDSTMTVPQHRHSSRSAQQLDTSKHESIGGGGGGSATAKPQQPQAQRQKKRRKSRAAPQPPSQQQSSSAATAASADELELGVSDFNKYGNGTGNSQKVKALRTSAAVAAAEVKRYSVPENVCEPMHMSLDEVKRFYHSLYSSSSDGGGGGDGRGGGSESGTDGGHATNASGGLLPPPLPQGNHCNNARRHNASVHNNNSITNNNNVMLLPDGGKQTATTTASTTASASNATATTTTPSTQPTKNTSGGGTPTKKIHNRHRKASRDGSGADAIPTCAPPTPLPATIAVTPTTPASVKYGCAGKRSQFSISANLKQKFCSIFRFRRSATAHIGGVGSDRSNRANGQPSRVGDGAMVLGLTSPNDWTATVGGGGKRSGKEQKKNMRFLTRALPPLPNRELTDGETSTATTSAPISPNADETISIFGGGSGGAGSNTDRTKSDETSNSTMDFAANIEKVKEYGWYWGPISSEAAEKILSNEPDGSFIVRDSSDDHYIFSLTFKLNNTVRHVRIEQDQGTFSFGSCAKFKSHTIMGFIENAVESSRSGRYLFFFHRRPEHGPMRVQLTNPVSRFKHIQSLQHMCRFVIRKTVVRKDLIQTLPLPRRLLDYVGYKNCFSEHLEGDSLQTADDEEHLNNGQQRRHHHQEEPPTEASPIAIEPAETIDIDDDTAL